MASIGFANSLTSALQKPTPTPPPSHSPNTSISTVIPTVDISPFLRDGDEAARKVAADIIGRASRTSGFFRIVNHGLPIELMKESIEASRTFFGLPGEKEGLGSKVIEGYPLPLGYSRPPDSPDRNEYLVMLSPELGVNVNPNEPPGFRSVLEECFTNLTKIELVVEDILNECLGLPPNFLKEYGKKHGRNDVLVALRYLPPEGATDTERVALSEHQDANYLTFLFQDDVGGLEALVGGEWIPVDPVEGSIIVNIAHVLQVMTNNIFKSATHRVMRKEKHRHSVAFFGNVAGERWVEPLPQFTGMIGVEPRYNGFVYKDYQQMRVRNKSHPPSKPEDIVHISHFVLQS